MPTILRRDADQVVPQRWRSAFRSVLIQYLRQGTMTREQADAAWADARALLTRNEQVPEAALVLDVALAEAFGVPLVTNDWRVLAACPDLAVSPTAFAA